MTEAKYEIDKLQNGSWVAASSSQPYFCFVGKTKTGVVAKAELAWSNYVRLERNRRRTHATTRNLSIARLQGETRLLAVG